MKSLMCMTLTVALVLFSALACAAGTKPSSFAPNWSESSHLSSPKHHTSQGVHHRVGAHGPLHKAGSKSHTVNHENRPKPALN
jgi:hypothetical protein